MTGLSLGMVYGIVAVGMLLVYSATSAVNLAHGELITTGMFATAIVTYGLGWPFWTMLIIGPALGFVIGVGMEAISFRPFINRRRGGGEHSALLMIFITTIALSLAIQGGFTLIFPPDGFGLPFSILPSYVLKIGLLRATSSDLLLLGTGTFIAVALGLWFRFTQAGRSMRAMSQNRQAAALMGVNTRRLAALAWGLSGLLGVVAGDVLGPGQIVNPYVGATYLFIAFAAAVLGGFGSVWGAILGGVLLGLAQSMFGAFVSTGWSTIVAFAFLMIILLLRPQGLIGRSLIRV